MNLWCIKYRLEYWFNRIFKPYTIISLRYSKYDNKKRPTKELLYFKYFDDDGARFSSNSKKIEHMTRHEAKMLYRYFSVDKDFVKIVKWKNAEDWESDKYEKLLKELDKKLKQHIKFYKPCNFAPSWVDEHNFLKLK